MSKRASILVWRFGILFAVANSLSYMNCVRVPIGAYREFYLTAGAAVVALRFYPLHTCIGPSVCSVCSTRKPPTPGEPFRFAFDNIIWPYRGFHFIVVPCWLLCFCVVMFVDAASFSYLALKRWYRAQLGLCVWCGYNLYKNKSGRCPECGSTFDGARANEQFTK